MNFDYPIQKLEQPIFFLLRKQLDPVSKMHDLAKKWPILIHSSNFSCRKRPAKNPATNASPAPQVSTISLWAISGTWNSRISLLSAIIVGLFA